ncbi:MCE family protein [Nocardia nova]|uniref:MCE family protein n=1 Tax=Nocardia nova TaxID=37330 RepID=UPI000CEA0B0C|nr:MCE family protein [Nocardia nova]PPJ24958.1 mammalian cell entry protein [Nocardia nova]
MTGTISRGKALILGFTAIAGVILAAMGAVASYNGSFTSSVRVYVHAERAGLLMAAGSDVKVDGVVVGRVAAVQLADNHAVLALDLAPGQARKIPSNVGAHIEPTTLFGRKFVSLLWPQQPASTRLHDGSVIDSATGTVEINDTLDTLLGILKVVDPQKINSTLTAASTALDGRGKQVGDLLTDLDHYLGQFNNDIPTLQRDIPLLADNLDTLAAATPDLMTTVTNLSATSRTIVDKQTSLSAFLLSFTGFGNAGSGLMDKAGTPLISALDALEPTTRMLAERAPSFPCFFASLNQSRKVLERALGGRPGLNIVGTLLLGNPPYAYPDDLPVNGADGAPTCYPYAAGSGGPAPGHIDFGDGSHAYRPVRQPLDVLGNPFAALIYELTR